MNWRVWAFNKLKAYLGLTALVPIGSMYGAGALTGTPGNKPFIVVSIGLEAAELRDDAKPVSSSQYLTVYAHDEPGDYLRIDSVLIQVRQALEGVVPDSMGMCAIWQGQSQDLGDDLLGTIMRSAEFRLIGRK